MHCNALRCCTHYRSAVHFSALQSIIAVQCRCKISGRGERGSSLSAAHLRMLTTTIYTPQRWRSSSSFGPHYHLVLIIIRSHDSHRNEQDGQQHTWNMRGEHLSTEGNWGNADEESKSLFCNVSNPPLIFMTFTCECWWWFHLCLCQCTKCILLTGVSSVCKV